MRGPSRSTLLTGAWKQRNEADTQSHLLRVLALSSPSSEKQESSITVVENKLKSILHIDPHPADPRQQHPTRTSAISHGKTTYFWGKTNIALRRSTGLPLPRHVEPDMPIAAAKPQDSLKILKMVMQAETHDGMGWR